MFQNPWQTLDATTVYDNPWIQVEHRNVLTPAGTPGIYGLVHFKNRAIGIVPVDADENTWLVGQYRYTLQQYSWEIVEGGGALDTDPLSAAQRELLEETGMSATAWKPLLEMHLSNSVSDEHSLIYVCKNLTQGAPQPEETELLQVRHLPITEAIAMVLRGEITDAMSVAALLKIACLKANGTWETFMKDEDQQVTFGTAGTGPA
jgi:8-oxo-dGTP pyrophosphatase MutT (NUDIX family)